MAKPEQPHPQAAFLTSGKDSSPQVLSPSPAQQKSSLIVRSDKDAISISAMALAPSFEDDPIMNWCLRRPDGSTLNDDPVYRQRLFKVLMAISYGGRASFVTIDGEWKCTGVLLPPGQKVGGLRGYLACWRDLLWCLWKAGWRTSTYLLFEHERRYVQQFHDAVFPNHREIMKNGDYYYLFFLGTAAEARGKGLGSAMLKYAQEVATKAGKPIYLESSKESNKALYLRHGFEVAKELVMGEGEVGRDGRVVTQGEQPKDGAIWWAMTWWPKDAKTDISSA